MKNKLIISSLFAFYLVAACHGTTTQDEQKQYDREIIEAYKLIDSGQTDRAIEKLNQMLTKNPNDTQLRVTLASAYARHAGISMTDFFPLAKTLSQTTGTNRKRKRTRALFERLAIRIPPEYNDAFKIIDALNRFVFELSDFMERFEKIPAIQPHQIPAILHAIYTLDGIVGITPGDSLFKALLKAVRFKHNFLNAKIIAPSYSCQESIQVLSNHIIAMSADIIDIFVDLEIAFPERAQNLNKSRMDIAESTRTLTSRLNLGNDEASLDSKMRILILNVINDELLDGSIKCTL